MQTVKCVFFKLNNNVEKNTGNRKSILLLSSKNKYRKSVSAIPVLFCKIEKWMSVRCFAMLCLCRSVLQSP